MSDEEAREVSYEHLDYDELTRIVLGEESIDEEFIENVFRATFKRFLKLCIACGDGSQPDQAVEIDVLRTLVMKNMVGDNLRMLFNVLDYKPSYVLMILLGEIDRKPNSRIVSNVFQAVLDGGTEEINEFFMNPIHGLGMIDVYNEFCRNKDPDRFLPLMIDAVGEVMNQITIDVGTYPGFKRLDFSADRYVPDNVLPLPITEIMHSIVINNTIKPRTISGIVVGVNNPLYRVLENTTMGNAYMLIRTEAYKPVLEVMLTYGMSDRATADSVQDTMFDFYQQLALTPAMLVPLWENCRKNYVTMAKIVIAACMFQTMEDEENVIDTNEFFRALYSGVQSNMIHGVPCFESLQVMKEFLPDDKILWGDFAAQHNVINSDATPEDLTRLVPIPRNMIN